MPDGIGSATSSGADRAIPIGILLVGIGFGLGLVAAPNQPRPPLEAAAAPPSAPLEAYPYRAICDAMLLEAWSVAPGAGNVHPDELLP